jgi:hypothetical protein
MLLEATPVALEDEDADVDAAAELGATEADVAPLS